MVESSRDRLAADFDAWVTVHGTAVLRFAFAVAGTRAAGEDLAQEALARAYGRWGTVSGMDDPLAYVRRTVSNLHVSWWRKIGRREQALGDRTEFLEQVAGVAPDQRATEVWHLCRRLPARQRVAVVLRYYEDLSYDEIGEAMGTSPSTARSQVSRALESLRTWNSSLGEPDEV
jgi:RNA polymerase sigma-70 factor (sigma-E family)